MKISQELKENVLKDISESKLSSKEIIAKYGISYASFFRLKKENTNEKSQIESQIDSENQESETENESNKESNNEDESSEEENDITIDNKDIKMKEIANNSFIN